MTQHKEIEGLMNILSVELSQLNATQERITQLKDKIWEMMREANLSRVCYEGKLTASARGRSLVVSHKRAEITEE